MKAELSALLDGELEQHLAQPLFAAVRARQELRDTWGDYGLIGDALRLEPLLDRDVTARVMCALDEEPTVLVPFRRDRRNAWPRAVMALAASVAGVGVVSWLAWGSFPGMSPAPTLALATAPVLRAVPVKSEETARGMREYLLAHQVNAPGLHMQGGAQHIRTVSAVIDR